MRDVRASGVVRRGANQQLLSEVGSDSDDWEA